MATGRLTWQNVAAPDFSGAVAAQRASALAFDSAMERLGGAVETFDNNRKDRADAAVMRNALQYQNADELQAAIASGALMQGVNPDHVREGALLKAQAQAGQLMALERDRQAIAASKQTFDHNAQNQPIILATNLAALDAQRLTTATEWNKYNRGEESHQANRFAAAEYKKLEDIGLIHDPAAMAQYRTTLDPSDPGHAALLSKIDVQFKDSITPIGAPGTYTGAALSAPQSGIRAVNGVPGINSPEAGAFYANAVQNNPLLPTFLKGLGMLETGAKNQSTIGNNNFFNIKDVSGKGPRRFDKVEGSNDAYREFAASEEAYAEVATLLARKYPAALTAKTPEEFGNALSNGVGGAKYATDPKHANKVVSMINQELKKAGSTPPPVATAPSTAPTAPAVATTAPATPATPVPAVAGSTPAGVATTPTTAAQMGIPGATPPPGSVQSEAAAIQAKVTQRTQGMSSAAANVARYSGFAKAMANTEMDFATARKSVMDASPGLDPKDVDNMLTQVMGMSPMTRSPAAAAWVVANAGVTNRAWDPFNWTNYSKINVDGVNSLIEGLTKDDGENVKAAVLIDEVNANVGKKIEEAGKKLSTTQEQMSAIQQRMQNVPPGSAAHNALSAQLNQLGAKAGEYRSQIDARSQMVEQLFEQAQQAGDPEGWAKRQAAAKAAANPPPAAPAQPEVPKWKRGMTATQVDPNSPAGKLQARNAEIRRTQEANAKERQRREQEQRREVAAQVESITPSVARTMSADQAREVMQNSAVFHRLPPNIQLLIERQVTN